MISVIAHGACEAGIDLAREAEQHVTPSNRRALRLRGSGKMKGPTF
ncbi:hypothetical protein [Paraburkholderia acidisoli]|uniref:Uncharacterized protein n=1 Tax=Paraburkholderia acidisoli TaxID=2571748 RepID=A0A7Z2GND4_9BURK|nr:hypothetical protein [Paraburkholderia acidisoli]QGZ64903.1 hypothetical protein FAZ98_24160 [Paraburkholderia acidisoli]